MVGHPFSLFRPLNCENYQKATQETTEYRPRDPLCEREDTSAEMAQIDVEEQIKTLLAKIETMESEKLLSSDSTRVSLKIELLVSETWAEDPNLWFARFDQVANFCNWTDGKRVSAILLCLRAAEM